MNKTDAMAWVASVQGVKLTHSEHEGCWFLPDGQFKPRVVGVSRHQMHGTWCDSTGAMTNKWMIVGEGFGDDKDGKWSRYGEKVEPAEVMAKKEPFVMTSLGKVKRCTCKQMTLMMYGCQCGSMDEERKLKAQLHGCPSCKQNIYK